MRALSFIAMPALIGPMLGPPLGGLIVTVADWRWIFFVNIPIGILGLVLATLYIPDLREENGAAGHEGVRAVGAGFRRIDPGPGNAGRRIAPPEVALACVQRSGPSRCCSMSGMR